MLVAVGLTLLLMTMVVTVMSQVMENISGSRATIEMTDRLRYARERVQKDLAGVTVFPNPPIRPESGQGYLEIIEGSMGVQPSPGSVAFNTDETGTTSPPGMDFMLKVNTGNFPADTTVGDLDDIVMFTARSQDEPFTGRFTSYNPAGVILDTNGNPYDPSDPNARMQINMVESHVAEIAYFVRGTTLYRRVLLVLPGGALLPGATQPVPIPARPLVDTAGASYSYYGLFDISARMDDGPYALSTNAGAGTGRLVANSLGDLTKREHRYAHQPYRFPHDARHWHVLGLPTLAECSSRLWPFPFHDPLPSGAAYTTNGRAEITPLGDTTNLWMADGEYPPSTLMPSPASHFDAWRNPYPSQILDRSTGMLRAYQATAIRSAEDVILTNVLSFDVKLWDPGAPQLSKGTSVYLPGDAVYLQQFSSNPTIVGFGAFVDLFGMRELESSSGSPDGQIAGHNPAPGVTYEFDPAAAPYNIATAPLPHFMNGPNQLSGIAAGFTAQWPSVSVYDTWSTHYEQDGIDQHGDMKIDLGTNGLDDDGVNGVDDPSEQEAPPPYAHPLRAVQIKIRTFDPDSRQVRETTIVHEFLPQ
ncbi:MAG: hypothetical protein K1X71_14500 [Pirellulales bacterium]|nr:hypothetical protein [Pirellulales bacterium]